MTETLQERFARALVARGEKEIIPSRSRKYRTFTRDGGGNGRGFFFLGRAGALRVGAASSASLRCSDKFKARLLGELAPSTPVRESV